MRSQKWMLNGLIGATALAFAGSTVTPKSEPTSPVSPAAVEVHGGDVALDAGTPADGGVNASIKKALAAFSSEVGRLSHPKALETAMRSYFAYKAENPGAVKKPYLYFVDYGQPSTAKRGYVFDMDKLKIVDGPFTVAHGRGSGPRNGVPTRFSNASGSAATSLGLYLAQETYNFSGKSAGSLYRSIGLRLKGLSGKWNSNARARGVVAHGAPYVTASGSGRSEGCPAMEQARAKQLLPKIANGGLVFLFAPNSSWMNSDPWLT